MFTSLGQQVDAWGAFILLPGIFEEHGIGEFGANGDFFAFQDEIGNAGPAALRGDVRPFEAQIAVFESFDFSQALHKTGVDCAPEIL